MSDKLAPTLQQIKVSTGKLILDPNNPRLMTRVEDKSETKDATDANLQAMTVKKLRATLKNKQQQYRIEELEDSIIRNGWVPIDLIFVRKLPDGVHYLVLEGNRRVTAIRNIITEKKGKESLRQQLQEIDVMEIVDKLPPDKLRRKISYLLGVRHLGSLVPWTPFAQARNILNRYLEICGGGEESFAWDDTVGQRVAEALCISLPEVKERLRVYRAMKQLGSWPQVKDSDGGMQDRYYSVCAGVLLGVNKKLNDYIRQDSVSFFLDDNGMERMDNLCHFSTKGRKDAPIVNPQEWQKLENILKDEDEVKRQENMRKVEIEKIRPSHVWAERAAELRVLQWDQLLLNIVTVLKTVSLGDDLTSGQAKEITERLVKLVDQLDKHDVN